MPYALVTGASSGIGLDAARFLIQKGFHVFASVRNAADAATLSERLGANCQPLIFDVTDGTAIAKAAETVSNIVGENGLQLLINNAGVAVNGPIQHLSIERLQMQFEVNVIGVIRVTQAFLPLLGASYTATHKGQIINISSVSALVTQPFLGPYCASKAALERLTDALRREVSIYGIKVVIVEPGPIRTEIWEKARQGADTINYNHTDYEPMLRRVKDVVTATEASALPVAQVSELIWKIYNTARPQTRYIIAPNRGALTLAMLLPHTWLDKVFAKQFERMKAGKTVKLRS
jgi:NAD(P)-dependent dehydrogenase (short-subunit alcohol dehydrogenase family)